AGRHHPCPRLEVAGDVVDGFGLLKNVVCEVENRCVCLTAQGGDVGGSVDQTHAFPSLGFDPVPGFAEHLRAQLDTDDFPPLTQCGLQRFKTQTGATTHIQYRLSALQLQSLDSVQAQGFERRQFSVVPMCTQPVLLKGRIHFGWVMARCDTGPLGHDMTSLSWFSIALKGARRKSIRRSENTSKVRASRGPCIEQENA